MPGHGYVWPEYDDYVGLVAGRAHAGGRAGRPGFARDGARRERRIDLAVFARAGLVRARQDSRPGAGGAAARAAGLSFAARPLAVPRSGDGRLRVAGGGRAGGGPPAPGEAGRARLARGAGARAGAGASAWRSTSASPTSGSSSRGSIRGCRRRRPAPTSFKIRGADYSRLPTFPVDGFGTRACYVALEWKPAPGITDGRGAQARLEPPAAGTVVETSWSPNRLELDVRLDAPATLIINQNYETGWRAQTERRQRRRGDGRGVCRSRAAVLGYPRTSRRAAGEGGDRPPGRFAARRRAPSGAGSPASLAAGWAAFCHSSAWR